VPKEYIAFTMSQSETVSNTNGHAAGIKMTISDLNSSATGVNDVRGKMKQFWEQYEPTPKSMMLCSAANDVLAAEDRQQILKTCPKLKGKRVLELGAGIGYAFDK
jgi:hypothetical protein